jgi:Protein of unknown function (DUF2384)
MATDLSAVALLELHDPETGRLDARRMAEYLDVPLTALAAALRKKYQAVYKTPAAPSLQEGLIPIKASLDILDRLIGDRAIIRAWLNSPHPDLGLRTPMQLILDGHANAVRGMLANALAGIPS